ELVTGGTLRSQIVETRGRRVGQFGGRRNLEGGRNVAEQGQPAQRRVAHTAGRAPLVHGATRIGWHRHRLVDVDVEVDVVVTRPGAELEVIAEKYGFAQVQSDAGDLFILLELQESAHTVVVVEAPSGVVLILRVDSDL